MVGMLVVCLKKKNMVKETPAMEKAFRFLEKMFSYWLRA